MRQASRRGWKRCRAADRREIGGIKAWVAARAVEGLMGQIAEFIDEEAYLSDVNQMARAGLWRNMQLAVDQSHQQRFIAGLFSPAGNRRGFGGGSK